MDKSQSKSPPGKSKKDGPMPSKWLQVIDLMVIGGQSFQGAMRSAGYSERYATTNGHLIKQDERFCKALEARQASMRAKSEDRRDQCLKVLDEIIHNPDAADRDVIAAVKEVGAMSGWHSSTVRHETTERQAQLDEAARQEAARIAMLALDTTRALPDVSQPRRRVQSVVQDTSDGSDVADSVSSDPEGRGSEE